MDTKERERERGGGGIWFVLEIFVAAATMRYFGQVLRMWISCINGVMLNRSETEIDIGEHSKTLELILQESH